MPKIWMLSPGERAIKEYKEPEPVKNENPVKADVAKPADDTISVYSKNSIFHRSDNSY